MKNTQSPEDGQTAFSFDALQRLQGDQLQLRALFGAMLRKAGGADWLAEALNREPSYASKIFDAANGVKNRKVQLDWFAPMLDDPGAAELLLSFLSERCGFQPPVRLRTVTKEQIHEAAAAVLSDMDPIVKKGVRQEIARRLGVRIEDIKL